MPASACGGEAASVPRGRRRVTLLSSPLPPRRHAARCSSLQTSSCARGARRLRDEEVGLPRDRRLQPDPSEQASRKGSGAWRSSLGQSQRWSPQQRGWLESSYSGGSGSNDDSGGGGDDSDYSPGLPAPSPACSLLSPLPGLLTSFLSGRPRSTHPTIVGMLRPLPLRPPRSATAASPHRSA
ncbi:Os05g0471761 [Oryza sativa Japonica Group]|uniref:Os05g0471761 protein n=1 Tax=Oryza sativa subsp. japonica TaxID=39947 RepID=A0A0P0WNQ2_ORYSJ|nr:Os05g0471761 [Oryza sativa Japonica Group]